MIKIVSIIALVLTMQFFIPNKEVKYNNSSFDSYNYEDDLYYATEPDENGNFNPELFDNEVNVISSTSSPIIDDKEDIYISNKQFLFDYFTNLKNNILQNRIGMCGYTAIGMFLSYYDSYWDDHFIEDKYESQQTNIYSFTLHKSGYNSPGVKNTLSNSPTKDSISKKIIESGITDTNSEEYKKAFDYEVMNFIIGEIEKDSFAGKLFSIALENGSIVPHYSLDTYYSGEKNGAVINKNYLTGVGVNYDVIDSVLRDYIKQNEFINDKIQIQTSKIDIKKNELEEKNRIRNEIIELIKQGKPVLCGGNGFEDKNKNGKVDKYSDLPDGSPILIRKLNMDTK